MSDPMDAIPEGHGSPMQAGMPGMPHMSMEVNEGADVVLAEGETLSPQKVLDALRPITDPEIMISLVDLGLVYGVDVNESGTAVTVRMTLTGPGCPVGPQILAAVHKTIARIPGVTDPDVELVWDPPWNPVVHASDEAKDMLGIW